MSEDTELLTGRAGNEAAAGYRDMPMANPIPADDAPPITPEELATTDSAAARHLSRDRALDFPEPTQRAYSDVETGLPRPENELVSAEQAAADLVNIREAERRAVQEQQNRDIQEALGLLQTEQLVDRIAAQPIQPVEPQAEPQPAPEQLQPQPEYTEQFPGVDPEIAQAFQNPKIRPVLEQVNAGVEQTKRAYQEAISQNANVALATLNASFPELVGMSAEQVRGALRMMPPQRVEAYRQHVGQVTALAQAYQHEAARQAQAQAQAQAQQAQAQARWMEQYRVAEVARYEEAIARDRSPEQIKALYENAVPMVEKYYGIPEQELRAIYTGEQRIDGATFLRSANFQLMLSDALSYRMSREALPRAVARPVAQVQRPGSSAEAITRTEAALAEAQSKLKPSMSAKEAANYLIARRSAR